MSAALAQSGPAARHAAGDRPAARERTHTLTGTGALLRFLLRRDRVRIPVWAATVALFFLYAATALGTVYPTQADRQIRAQLISSPAAVMMTGPGYGAEDYTLGAMIANEMALALLVAVAVMSIQMIVRHTRTEEETGRSELVRAAVVGRHAPATAAFCATVVANAAVALLSGLVLVGSGLAAADSFALGAAVGVTGLVFAAVAVVTSQVTEHGRAATGLALAVLGVAFLTRAIGDIRAAADGEHENWLSWLSPIGWAQQIRAYVDLRWWPLGLSLVATAVLLVAGSALAARRDVGAGLVRPRPGRAHAVASLRRPFALTVRLQRGSVWAWGIGLGVMAAACGTFVKSVPEMLAEVDENSAMNQILPPDQDPLDAFVVVMTTYLVLGVTAFAISSALRARAEEAAGRVEPLLATPVSRSRWLAAQLAVTAGATVALTLVSGLALGVGAYSTGQTDPSMPDYVVAAVVYLPAIAVVLGLVWALYGWAPRWAGLAWVLLGYGYIVGMFGTLLDLPEWAMQLSPFWHVPHLPGGTFDAVPLLAETGLAAILFAVGFAGFRRRDIGR